MADARRVCTELTDNALKALDPLPEPLRGRLSAITRFLADRTV